jgi:hypothetical protein
VFACNARISHIWVGAGCLLLAIFVSTILTPDAELLAAALAALSACLAAIGFFRRPFSALAIAADSLVFILGAAMFAVLVLPRLWRGH